MLFGLFTLLSLMNISMSYVVVPGLKYTNSLDFVVSDEFNTKQYNLIKEAGRKWLFQGVGFSFKREPQTYQLERDGVSTITLSTDLRAADAVIYGTYLADNHWFISEVDIRVNTDNIIDDSSFYNAILHELGHASGLFHSKDKNSVMGASLSMTPNGKTIPMGKFEITQDDINGLNHIRGEDETDVIYEQLFDESFITSRYSQPSNRQTVRPIFTQSSRNYFNQPFRPIFTQPSRPSLFREGKGDSYDDYGHDDYSIYELDELDYGPSEPNIFRHGLYTRAERTLND